MLPFDFYLVGLIYEFHATQTQYCKQIPRSAIAENKNKKKVERK